MSRRARHTLCAIALVALLASISHAQSDPDELMPCRLALLKGGAGDLMKFVCKGTFALPSPANAPTAGYLAMQVFDSPSFQSYWIAFLVGNWRGLGNPSGSNGYKFSGARVPGYCTTVLIKPSVVKGVCWNDGSFVPPVVGSARIVLTSIGADSKSYCAQFGGTATVDDSSEFKATNAPAPVSCFDSTTTTSVTTTSSTSSTTTSTILVASPPLAGLAQWVRADAGVSVDGSNNVLSWADQSGNGRDWSQAGGTVQLVPSAQNGLPVVRSSGSSDYLTTPAYFTGTQEAEVLVLIKSNRPGTDVNYAWAGFGNDPSVINHYPWYASTIYETFGHTTRQGPIAIGNGGNATRAYGVYDVAAGTGASNYVLYLNGTELGATTGSPGWHAGTFYLFSYWFNQSYQFLGDIGELLVYDHVLSAADRDTAYQYLKQRWGTSDGL